MKKTLPLLCFAFLVFFSSCKTTKPVFNPEKKYSPEQLRRDYTLFRKILEDCHPSLYWYTSKKDLDHYFDQGYAQIRDSMDELRFRAHLSYVISKIDCGHTSIRYSKKYTRYLDTTRAPQFPLVLKWWGDTLVVVANLNRRDSVLKRGVILKSINGLSVAQLRDTLFNYVVTDGYSSTGKYQTLSTGLNFGNWYTCVFGRQDAYTIRFLDPQSAEQEVTIPNYDSRADSSRRDGGGRGRKADSLHLRHVPEPGTKRRRQSDRFRSHEFQVDTSGHTAFMTLYTFAHGNHLRGFFRRSFKTLQRQRIPNLVIDVRSNGGGDANLSTLLTRYLVDRPFKLADSLYAIKRHSQYDRYVEKSNLYHFLMLFVTHREDDGRYHFGYFERHYFEPKENHHFDGQVYILIGGNSFSATTLFAGSLKGQHNVTLVGEETGGGAYGNTAWMIPDVELPNTGIRFRLPKFRLVIDQFREKDGRGVMPDVTVLPRADAISRGVDYKTEKVKELIRSSK
ncbi:MAG: S41 family peptidase [Puia sp.]|nr:S41 family peptidase [Puia sp.]